MIGSSSAIALSVGEWLRLAWSLLLFLGLGYGLLSFYPPGRRYDVTLTVALALGLSLAAWSLLLIWLKLLPIALNPVVVQGIFSAGWLLGLIRMRPWAQARPLSAWLIPDLRRVLLWLALALVMGVSLWALRGAVAGLGSDSYHHTLVVQLILERGGLPDDYAPYAPIVTFTYHFGFHALVAAIAWLTDLTPLVLTPILGQVLTAAAALSVAYFIDVALQDRSAALIAVVLVGLVSVFPAYLVNWGRYTQLTGLVLLPLILGLVWEWAETGFAWSSAPWIGMLAGGTALAHYRVTLMVALGGVILLGVLLLNRRPGWREVRRAATQSGLAGLAAALVTAPWAWNLVWARERGYAVDLGRAAPSFFALERLGDLVLGYPTNVFMIGLVFVAVVVGLWRRERLVIGLAVWSVLMLVASTPGLAGEAMDTISVVISLYFPSAAIAGWFVSYVLALAYARWRPVAVGIGLGLSVVAFRGAWAITQIAEPGAAYVQTGDLEAMAWIRAHTPPSARFMVNMFHWDFLPKFVVGSDAGYWLPLLAGRQTVTVPMVYSRERTAEPDLVENLLALDQWQGHLTSPEALAQLRQAKITHIYIGQRGGPIVVDELLASPVFELAYHNGQAYVFRIIDTPPPQ